ncbi:hypothetical protein AJ80_06383 [Polytolypa hystricis UAMH7299]|uniref:Uncharacterized protein n=1 Tax=Polytolypa hystricis (strain UAMH7299) TaxID=1447883 RepID=A0A2B7XWV5_POLH7|nr:hypothetical protein AJ80_06383 [Polytolypa hystricis UAMH7299]
MPRAKRAKRSSSSNPQPPPETNPEPTAPASEKDNIHEETASNASSAPTFDDIEPNDVALLDEEEIPEELGDIGAGPSKKRPDRRSTYAVGGGGYNALKTFKGQVYSGMAIGGSHTWNYDQGVWKETKVEPDLWKVDYSATKRRAKNAPRGSGAPVGTEYHWFIVAHQNVRKVDANTYETSLVGSKYKLAHKGAAAKSWSIPTVKGQREREIELLDDAKRRVEGLPPVTAREGVKVEKHEKGQQKLDSLFAKVKGGKDTSVANGKRKREAEDEGEEGSLIQAEEG